jgi:hypothetical protein
MLRCIIAVWSLFLTFGLTVQTAGLLYRAYAHIGKRRFGSLCDLTNQAHFAYGGRWGVSVVPHSGLLRLAGHPPGPTCPSLFSFQKYEKVYLKVTRALDPADQVCLQVTRALDPAVQVCLQVCFRCGEPCKV